MRVLIEDYRNLTAEHCGSGSMRNLLFHYCGLELDEAVVFGLGSGLDCMFLSVVTERPPFMLFGRGPSMEADLASALGVDYRETRQADDNLAWSEVAAEVAAGRPTMLSGDILYLDYREYKVHFPGHRFVLLGYDDELQDTYLADRTDVETQTCSMQGLRLSRNAPVGISSENLWGKFYSGDVQHSLGEACETALKRTTGRMLGSDHPQVFGAGLTGLVGFDSGLAGIQTLANAMDSWPCGEEALIYARYIDNCIVKFGTGGGFFRNLFADFIGWARVQRPDLVDAAVVDASQKAAALWNSLADLMRDLVPTEDDCWQPAQQKIQEIHRVETALFKALSLRFTERE